MKAIQDQTILITGATDGLGRAVAFDLAGRGAELLLHGRNDERGQRVVEEIKAKHPEARLQFYRGDLSRFADVRRLAEAVRGDHDRLDALVNNAGIYADERQLSEDGNELVFQVNYLSHVLLTELLLPLLRASAPSRIVNVASAGQAAIDFDDVMLERFYSGSASYQRSKLSQIMFTIDLAERLRDEKITVNALHPATFMPTKMVVGRFPPSSTITDGAAATLRLVVSPELEGVTGRYFNRQHEERAHRQAYDEAARKRLGEITAKLIS